MECYSDSDTWNESDMETDTNDDSYKLWKPPPLNIGELQNTIEIVKSDSVPSDWVQVKKSKRNYNKKTELNFSELHTQISTSVPLENETKKRITKPKKKEHPQNIENNQRKPDRTVSIEFYNDVNGTVTEICKINRVCKLNNGTFELYCDLDSNTPTPNSGDNKDKNKNSETKKPVPDILIQIEKDPKDLKKPYREHKNEQCVNRVANMADESPYFEIKRTKKRTRNKNKNNKKTWLQKRNANNNKQLIENLTYYFNFVAKLLLVYIFFRLVRMGHITSLMHMLVTNVVTLVFVASKLALMFACWYLGVRVFSFLFNTKPMVGVFDFEVKCGVQSCAVPFSSGSRKIYSYRKRS